MCLGNKPASLIYIILLLRTKNKDSFEQLKNGGVMLKRGQCVCGREELAEWLGLKKTQSGKIDRILIFLEKTAKLIDKRRTRNGTIITIRSYDKVIGFSKQTNQQTNYRQTTDTNKSVKIDKTTTEIEENLLSFLKRQPNTVVRSPEALARTIFAGSSEKVLRRALNDGSVNSLNKLYSSLNFNSNEKKWDLPLFQT